MDERKCKVESEISGFSKVISRELTDFAMSAADHSLKLTSDILMMSGQIFVFLAYSTLKHLAVG